MKSPTALATQWLREFARTYLPSNSSLEFCPEMLASEGIHTPDLTCFFRWCRVIGTGDVDSSGSVWTVVGTDCDGGDMRAQLVVRTQEMSIRVRTISRLRESEQSHETA